jgi:hypothetical protein
MVEVVKTMGLGVGGVAKWKREKFGFGEVRRELGMATFWKMR